MNKYTWKLRHLPSAFQIPGGTFEVVLRIIVSSYQPNNMTTNPQILTKYKDSLKNLQNTLQSSHHHITWNKVWVRKLIINNKKYKHVLSCLSISLITYHISYISSTNQSKTPHVSKRLRCGDNFTMRGLKAMHKPTSNERKVWTLRPWKIDGSFVVGIGWGCWIPVWTYVKLQIMHVVNNLQMIVLYMSEIYKYTNRHISNTHIYI